MNIGDIVIMHLGAGDMPGIVTRVNVDGTLNLSVFVDGGEVVYRQSVVEYQWEAEDEESDKIGMWSRRG